MLGKTELLAVVLNIPFFFINVILSAQKKNPTVCLSFKESQKALVALK